MVTATCDGCGAPILWAVTPAGKRQPMDPDPDPTGNRWLFPGADEADPPISAPADVDAHPDRPRFKTHFATCPEAERFRKRA